MTTETIHTCSYECERPECIRAQRDELVATVEALRAEVGELHMHAKRRDQYAVEKAAQALDWKKRAERLAEALRRYRNEVPIGHQPHMLAHEVDDLLRDQEEGK